MKVFFDTSVLVAVFWGDHPQHEPCLEVFRQATPARAFCAAHSMAELYAVMTRLPVRPPISGEQAMLFLGSLHARVSPVALSADDYVGTLERAAGQGAIGGQVYDLLLLECARRCAADIIYTLDRRDFPHFAADLAERIRFPSAGNPVHRPVL